MYIEITNRCNLSCSFCSVNNNVKREMSLGQFELILKKINDYTDYLYLHVKGEPLIHSELDGILKLCEKYGKKVNITTNGVLIDKRADVLIDNKIRQLNISLHSENNKVNYLDDILSVVDKMDSYIVFRFWVLEDPMDERFKSMVKRIIEYYKLPYYYFDKIVHEDNIKVTDKVYINKSGKFVWPEIDNDYYDDCGYCHGLKDQIGILVDGTVIVCCLDSNGESNLGNIFEDSFEEIIGSEKALMVVSNFEKRKCYLEICKHCSYKDRFKKNKE